MFLERSREVIESRQTAPAEESTRSAFCWCLIESDLRAKAQWCYGRNDWKAMIKVLLTDGTAAMILYCLMQWAHRWRLFPLEMLFNKLNGVCCSCIIGRGAEFGPGFVLIHSQGVVINGEVRGGAHVFVEHQVTIGTTERRQNPQLGNNVYLGAGAKVIGAVTIGDGARVGANAVVVHDVPAGATVVGIPARVVRQRPVEAANCGAQTTAVALLKEGAGGRGRSLSDASEDAAVGNVL